MQRSNGKIKSPGMKSVLFFRFFLPLDMLKSLLGSCLVPFVDPQPFVGGLLI